MPENKPPELSDQMVASALCVYDFRVPTELHEYWWAELLKAVKTFGADSKKIKYELKRIQADLESKGAKLDPVWADCVAVELSALKNIVQINDTKRWRQAATSLISSTHLGSANIGGKVKELEDRIKEIETNYPTEIKTDGTYSFPAEAADAMCFFDWRVPTELHGYWWQRLREAVDTHGLTSELIPEIERIEKELESAGAKLVNQWSHAVLGELLARAKAANSLLGSPALSALWMLTEANRMGRWHAGNKIKELEDRIAALENSEEKTGKL